MSTAEDARCTGELYPFQPRGIYKRWRPHVADNLATASSQTEKRPRRRRLSLGAPAGADDGWRLSQATAPIA